MKKSIIAILVGALILFAYQSLSWMILPIHENSVKYTSTQDPVLGALASAGLEEGVYMMPSLPLESTDKEHMEAGKANEGKPWVLISYHPVQDKMNMGKMMGTGLLLDLLAVWLLVWIIRRGNFNGLGTICRLSFGVGLIIVFASILMDWNWWQTPMHYVSGQIIDQIIGWLLVGIWMGWYLGRKAKSGIV